MSQKNTSNSYRNSTTGGNSSGRSRSYDESYVQGNTVRKLQAAPQRAPQEKPARQNERELTPEEQYEIHRHQRAARQNRRAAERMDLRYSLFLSAMAVFCAVVCGFYVYLQADIRTNMEEITALETELSDLKADNDAVETELETMMDLESIREEAEEEMGMSYPDSDQVMTYSLEITDYMNQYDEVGD